MANILILGAGAMGTAFSFPCIDNNHNVSIIGTHLENQFIDQIKKNNFHMGLNIEISKKVKFFKNESISDFSKPPLDLIVLSVNSKGINSSSE